MNEKTAQTPPPPNYNVDHLRTIGDSLSTKYHPLFKKYLDKAIQHAQPNEVEHNPDKLTVDGNSYGHYINAVAKAKKVVGFSKASNKLLQDLYKAQASLKEDFNKFLLIEQEIRKYINHDGQTMLLNQDSSELINELHEVMKAMEETIAQIKSHSEQGFDSIQPLGL